MDDRERLAIRAATSFDLTESGRIRRVNSPEQAPSPRLYLASCASGIAVRLRHDVSGRTAIAIEELGAAEPSTSDPAGLPAGLDRYVQLLAAEAPVEQVELGLLWELTASPGVAGTAALVRSGTDAGDRLIVRLAVGGMPPALVALGFGDVDEFWAPWCAAMEGDEIASIAFAARLRSESAEVGVATVPAFRGRGFAAAATAGWASHRELRGRLLFYGTSRANISSRRVTERLGLRFIGPTLSIT